MRIRILLLVTAFVIYNHCVFAQNEQYQFSHLDINNGLSSNQINCIFKDSQGFMWFGTTSGLNRYDGYHFRVFKNSYHDSSSLSDNYVSRIFEGPGKKLWILTHNYFSIYDPAKENFSNNVNKDLFRYKVYTNDLSYIKPDGAKKYWFLTNDRGIYQVNTRTHVTINYSNSPASKVRLHANQVMDIATCGNGLYWLVYGDGVLEKLDTRSGRITERSKVPITFHGSAAISLLLTLDFKKNLWIWASGSQLGVYQYNTTTYQYKHLAHENSDLLINSNIVNNIVSDEEHKIWIGTDHGGINIVDPVTFKITYLLSREDNPKSLRGNSVVLYKGNDDIIWAGTYKQGISYYHKGMFQFPVVRRIPSDISSLPFEDVDCFKEDKKGNLWIGTNGGGLIFYDKEKKNYIRYTHSENDANSLSNNIVISLCIDHKGKLWIGSYFGGLDCFDGRKFTHHRHNDKVAGSISDDRVYAIFEDAAYNLWTGTFAGGISIFNTKTGLFFNPGYLLLSNYVASLYPGGADSVWVGGDKGVDLINTRTGNVKHYTHSYQTQNSIAANDINSIIKDSRGLMWIGTKGGLSILNPKTNRFINLYEDNGLSANNILDVLEDRQGRMWMSSTNGINYIKPGTDGHPEEVKHFDESDGLQGREFNVKAAYKTANGRMIFGGAHGFNVFDPGQISIPVIKPPLVFTDLQLFNQSVSVGDTIKGGVVLQQSITKSQSVVFNHNQNVFSIEFASCNFFNPHKVQYKYRLEGFDKGWLISSPNIRKATYTNLDAGEYVFRVMAQNGSNPADAATINLKITVLPPFWKSPLAYLLYGVLFISCLFYIRHRGILKLKKEFALKQQQIETERRIEQERAEVKRMHELDLMKIKFFTNVSHEFRTPLSLILSPIDQLIKVNDKPEQQQQLVMIKRNGRRLLNLVNQLLDFRKMEFKELKINLAKGDIIEYIREVANSFCDIAQKKNISYVIESDVEALTTRFDHDKLERILFNLLSNAFKFTPANGHICVLMGLQHNAAKPGQQMLEIKVIDTGIGITADKQQLIFERFFQDNMPASLLNQGSGIGLSITREFVKMHNGTISVESEAGQGSCFSILLPVTTHENSVKNNQAAKAEAVVKIEPVHEHILDHNKKPLILLVEDNDDMRFYLKDNLKHHFAIAEAANGKEGWQKTLGMQPEMVVSDISMPEMNGIELCKKIKGDLRTAHIPVVLLTALCEEVDQLSGLESGANDYIMKPFNFEILLSKINNLLQLHQTLRKTYKKQIPVNVAQVQVESEDEKFIKNAVGIIETNINNPNFSVEELSRLMLLSRVSLYKRMLTLTGRSPVDFIRSVRLKRAVQLLEKSKMNIAGVAYEVGFNNPTYFAKVFREEYGMLPSDYLNRMRQNELKPADPMI